MLAPARHVSSDTVPGRYGAALIRCGGGFDLRRVAWIAALAKPPYWVTRDGVSVYGPAPALVGSLALADLGDGDPIDDSLLRRRERTIAAVLVALATVLLVLAAAARRSILASVAIGLVAAASFAGMATLGQGLWQQTVALPMLVGALATLAWRERRPRLAWLTPALLALAVMVRPTLGPLAVGLGLAWCVARPDRRTWLVASVLAVMAVLPLALWNLQHTGSPLPTGQLAANAAVTRDVFLLSRAQLGAGLGGLLLSPGRGLLVYAPIVLVGLVLALRPGPRPERVVAGALVAQILVMACFHMWWGGICFGPRFLAEVTWIAVWLALGSAVRPADSRAKRVVVGIATAVTVVVGQLGLWCWRAEQWETRRNPDIDQTALWDVVDSPIAALGRDIDDELFASDAPFAPARMRCVAGQLENATSGTVTP